MVQRLNEPIATWTEGDRVTVRFAAQFKRPARLTIGEAAALLIALRALPPARGGPMASAVAGLIRKLETALGTGQVKRLARHIGARRAAGALGHRLKLLQAALDEQREVEIEYYTARRRALSTRRVRPYALMDLLGHSYLVGKDSLRGRERSFRVDRIRSVTPTDKTFEKPRSFNAQRYLRPEFYRAGPDDKSVRVRFAAAAARYVREMSQPSEIRERPRGAVERTVKTDSLRWVVDWSLQHGADAEVLGPPAARREARKVLDEWIAFYRAHPSR